MILTHVSLFCYFQLYTSSLFPSILLILHHFPFTLSFHNISFYSFLLSLFSFSSLLFLLYYPFSNSFLSFFLSFSFSPLLYYFYLYFLPFHSFIHSFFFFFSSFLFSFLLPETATVTSPANSVSGVAMRVRIRVRWCVCGPKRSSAICSDCARLAFVHQRRMCSGSICF